MTRITITSITTTIRFTRFIGITIDVVEISLSIIMFIISRTRITPVRMRIYRPQSFANNQFIQLDCVIQAASNTRLFRSGRQFSVIVYVSV